MDAARGHDGASVGVVLPSLEDHIRYRTEWHVEKWSEEATVEAFAFALRKRIILPGDGVEVGGSFVPVTKDAVPSSLLRDLGIVPDLGEETVEGNLLLNEGIARMLDLLIGAGGTTFANASAYIGVGSSNTAEAATQTELQAAQGAGTRFYKAMVASYPQRTNQTVDWRSDFTGTEANFAWEEWTVSSGASTASGAGFLVGTTNLNRKVQALGTKAAGTWTMTASITFS